MTELAARPERMGAIIFRQQNLRSANTLVSVMYVEVDRHGFR